MAQNRNLFSHDLGGRGLRSKCWQAMISSKTLQKRTFLPLVVSGNTWHSLACRCITPTLPSFSVCLLHVSVSLVSKFPSYKDASHIVFRARPKPVWPMLTWLHLQTISKCYIHRFLCGTLFNPWYSYLGSKIRMSYDKSFYSIHCSLFQIYVPWLD